MLFFSAGEFGKVAEAFADRGRKFLLNEREQCATNAIAGMMQVEVRGIVAPRLANFAEIALYFGTADLKQRPDDLPVQAARRFRFDVDDREDACQATGPGPSQEPQKNCFRLIVESVRGCDAVENARPEQRLEVAVSQTAGGGFKTESLGGGIGGNVVAGMMKLQIVAAGEFAHEGFVGVGGSAANVVVEVNYREHDAQFVFYFEQEAQK